MLQLFFSILLLLVISEDTRSDHSEGVILNRMEYIYHLKNVVDKSAWKGFADKPYDLPLVYYTGSACYVANPTEKFLAVYHPVLVLEKPGFRIFKTGLLDSIPFHMETGITFGSPDTAYNHQSPFMNCSSLEITQQHVPGVDGTEQWATMVIHEYFHGYQFKHAAHLDYFEKHIAVAADTLKRAYKAYPWYKKGVDRENGALLAALQTTDAKKKQVLVDSFFAYRAHRQQQMKQQGLAGLLPIEQVYETKEGTARYAEFSLYRYFAQTPPDSSLLKSDTSYQSYRYFRNYVIEKDPWLYRSDRTAYYYATGFNMVRLLNQLKVNYSTRLFKEGGLSLENILEQYRKQ